MYSASPVSIFEHSAVSIIYFLKFPVFQEEIQGAIGSIYSEGTTSLFILVKTRD